MEKVWILGPMEKVWILGPVEKVCRVFWFLLVLLFPSEIDCRLIEMYGDGVRRDQRTTIWCRETQNCPTNIRDDDHTSEPGT
jgi:hypothetical protein